MLCIQEGFSYIQQHISTRLNYPSIDMGYDTRYICHCYDIMEKLASSCNDTILVINRSLIVSEDKNGGLGIIGIGDSSILGFGDSK